MFTALPLVCGPVTSAKRTAPRSGSKPEPCGSTATTSSTLRCPSADTSNPAGAAKWATMCSTTTPKPRRCAHGSREVAVPSRLVVEYRADALSAHPHFLFAPSILLLEPLRSELLWIVKHQAGSNVARTFLASGSHPPNFRKHIRKACF